jgi:hypothetical protein
MYLGRIPIGVTYYNRKWSSTDSEWTDELVAQVPLGIDPRTSKNDGIHVLPNPLDGEECFVEV